MSFEIQKQTNTGSWVNVSSATTVEAAYAWIAEQARGEYRVRPVEAYESKDVAPLFAPTAKVWYCVEVKQNGAWLPVASCTDRGTAEVWIERNKKIGHPHAGAQFQIVEGPIRAETTTRSAMPVEPPRPSKVKARVELIPAKALLEVGELLARTEDGSNRWRDLDVTGHISAALRHTLTHLRGETIDADTGKPHLVCAAARLLYAVAR